MKLKPYIEAFDKKMIDSLMLDREAKYNNQYAKHRTADVSSTASLSKKADYLQAN